MKRFELKKIGMSGFLEVEAFVCKDKSHFIPMTEEEAKNRGVEDKWKDGGIFGEFFARSTVISEKVTIPRNGKKSRVAKLTGLLIRCDVCGYSEKILPVSPGDQLFKEVYGKSIYQ